MKKLWNRIKEKFKDFIAYTKKFFAPMGETLKIFFSSWRNWAMVACFIVAIVFICLWNISPWCKFVGLCSLTIALALLAWYFTIFYLKFVESIESQKRAILEELATQFERSEYLELKTPFNEKDEKFIKSKIKSYRNIMIGCWLVFAVSLFAFISILF